MSEKYKKKHVVEGTMSILFFFKKKRQIWLTDIQFYKRLGWNGLM